MTFRSSRAQLLLSLITICLLNTSAWAACANDQACVTADPNFPVCDQSVTNGECKVCYGNTNTGCSGNLPICDTTAASGKGQCKACQASDCSGTKPICNAANAATNPGQCVACTTNAQCNTKAPATPICNTQTGACAACTTTTDNAACLALDVKTPFCTANLCARCANDQGCATAYPTKPVCITTSTASNYGACVQCVDNTKCTTDSAAKCITATNTCGACTIDGDCTQISGGKTQCLSGTCVAPVTCTSNTQCTTAAAPKCNTANNVNRCEACSTNTDCANIAGKPTCTSGVCVAPSSGLGAACTTNAQCTTAAASRCVSGACAVCASNSDCTQITDKPVCVSGTCSASATILANSIKILIVMISIYLTL